MDVQNRMKTALLHVPAVLLLGMALLVMLLGITYARYEQSESRVLRLTYEAKTEQVYIRPVEKVAESVSDTEVMAFLLSNGTSKEAYCTYDQIAELSLFATIGLEDPEKFTITLTDGGVIYRSDCFEVVEGSTLYALYGPGWIYRFYNEAGEEAAWQLSGAQFIEKEMFITVEGASQLPAALNLIVSAKPGAL